MVKWWNGMLSLHCIGFWSEDQRGNGVESYWWRSDSDSRRLLLQLLHLGRRRLCRQSLFYFSQLQVEPQLLPIWTWPIVRSGVGFLFYIFKRWLSPIVRDMCSQQGLLLWESKPHRREKCTGKVLETEREIELRFNSCGLLLWEGAELSVVRNWPLSLWAVSR